MLSCSQDAGFCGEPITVAIDHRGATERSAVVFGVSVRSMCSGADRRDSARLPKGTGPFGPPIGDK